ncbi:MBOAT family O-acyltransferase [Litorilituus sediminis]|uniref:Probable alginate O-acetylase n=1 Tax=Litorilituus sediminis TaxID=718192 RepID=A0A4P6P4N6_9GAMM|nr:MBOAT family O-acyltransferase [Litorilituus sediminis]QBG36354.1 MBOAT family protein [Litorilituus sediminis]
MLFNSAEFIFLFLPISLLLFFTAAKRWGNEAAITSLVACSLFFYGWWNPSYLLLLLASMAFNYHVGKRLGNNNNKNLLILGITVNLAAIAYFKYAGFIVFNINALTGAEWDLGNIILPLAISFFTFQQIAYLVDSYRGITKEYSFLHYALFVAFFPQLIAGPIVHHKDMLPQFSQTKRYQLNHHNIKIGLTIFAIGLFKKTVLADGIAVYANPIFSAADAGQSVDFFSAWGGTLAYTFQLYFDFSGYSDMAIGIARLFGIILPLNFYSPYKAANISEFWRRWHITLSHFLRDYLYIALGGNRSGKVKRYTNLAITMLLGGLWHGAGWNFIIWGALHGSYLMLNLAWQAIKAQYHIALNPGKIYVFFAWLLTFLAVIVGWVFFRAVSLDGALTILQGMLGLNGISVPNAILSRLGEAGNLLQTWGVTPSHGGAVFVKTWLWNITLLAFVLTLPNVQDLFAKEQGTLSNYSQVNDNTFWPTWSKSKTITWSSTTRWAAFSGACLALGILTLSQVSEFLYFQF